METEKSCDVLKDRIPPAIPSFIFKVVSADELEKATESNWKLFQIIATPTYEPQTEILRHPPVYGPNGATQSYGYDETRQIPVLVNKTAFLLIKTEEAVVVPLREELRAVAA